MLDPNSPAFRSTISQALMATLAARLAMYEPAVTSDRGLQLRLEEIEFANTGNVLAVASDGQSVRVRLAARPESQEGTEKLKAEMAAL